MDATKSAKVSLERLLVPAIAAIVTLRGFGQLQAQVVPPVLVQLLYFCSCLSLLALTLVTQKISLKSALASVVFACSLVLILLIQLFRLDVDFLQVGVKAVSCAFMFAFLATLPDLNPELLLKALRIGSAFGVLASCVAVVAHHGIHHYYAGTVWIGWFAQKNYLGLCAALCCITQLAHLRDRRGSLLPHALLIALSLALLVLSKSRGAQLWLCVGVLFTALQFLGFRVTAIAYFVLTICLAALTLILVAPDSALYALQDLSSGRTSIWSQARDAMRESSIWIGGGFGSSYKAGSRFFDQYGNVFPGAHNGYLTLLLDSGVFGLSVYAVMMGFVVRSLGQLRTYHSNILIGIAAAFMVHNLVEAAIDKSTHVSFMFFPLALASCSAITGLRSVDLRKARGAAMSLSSASSLTR